MAEETPPSCGSLLLPPWTGCAVHVNRSEQPPGLPNDGEYIPCVIYNFMDNGTLFHSEGDADLPLVEAAC